MSRREEGFLARWSRRKRGLERDEDPPPAGPATAAPASPGPALPLPDEATAPAPPAAGSATPPALEFDPASLPPVESLTPESDLAPFLRPEVPAALRQAALRRLWSLDPTIRDFVGPADYAWDYNAAGGAPGFALDLAEEARRRLLAMLTAPAEPPRRPAEPARGTTREDAAPPEPQGIGPAAPAGPDAADPHTADPHTAGPDAADPPAADPPPVQLAGAPPAAPRAIPVRPRHGGALPR